MATVARRTDSSIESQLLTQTSDFDFHQTVKILEGLRPGSKPLGEGDDPRQEALSIHSHISLSLPGSDLHSLKLSENLKTPAVLTVNFLGIAGIQGPLPTPYTEFIMERQRQCDTTSRDFLDIFNHRLISLWHRARLKTVVGLAQLPPQKTAMGKTFLDLVGLESKHLQKQLSVPDHRLLHFASLFWHRPRSAVVLQQIVCRYLGISDIQITQLQGCWQHVFESETTQLGKSFNELGRNAVLGKRQWHQSGGIVVQIKNLTWENFQRLLPEKKDLQELEDLIHFYCGLEVKTSLRISINPKDIPQSHLGKQMLLGRTSWLGKGKGYGQRKDASITISSPLKSRQIYHSV